MNIAAYYYTLLSINYKVFQAKKRDISPLPATGKVDRTHMNNVLPQLLRLLRRFK